MTLKYIIVIFLWLESIKSLPSKDEFGGRHKRETSFMFEDIKDILLDSDDLHPTSEETPTHQLQDFFEKGDVAYNTFMKHVEAGHAMKGLTFSIYDDNMRDAAVALFHLLRLTCYKSFYNEDRNFSSIQEWAYANINKDMLYYALNLVSLYKVSSDYLKLEPPFMFKPNYFVNSETIRKAQSLMINNGKFDPQEGEVNQIYLDNVLVIINTNYSGWNLYNEEYGDNLNYFREDISLNSYYYGVHILHPFWMSEEDLSSINYRYAEKYYYIHQQLLARYSLEKEHLKQRNISTEPLYKEFEPYLIYDNGLAFPRRLSIRREWNEEYARLKSIDIAINEYITRGVVFMDDGQTVTITEDNYVDLLTRLIRAKYENPQTSKLIRDLFGYGGKGYPSDRYNPAPSVIHHPQTTLRDPIYWYLIENSLKYVTEYASTLEPYNFSKYQSEDIAIIGHIFPSLTTYYDYYHVSLNNIFDNANYNVFNSPLLYSARQRRLKHKPFHLSFSFNSNINKTALVKLFLGPSCEGENCWKYFAQFFELDCFPINLEQGLNLLRWTSDRSKYSFDDYYNIELKTPRKNRFDLLKFPQNLIIPKGLSEGLKLTLFILILPVGSHSDFDFLNEIEPLGFPFHRQVLINSTASENYKFLEIFVHHKENIRKTAGYYSPHLN